MGVPCKICGKLRSKALRDKEFPQKKVLSLVLCVAVMLSVMVMGAGAAFSDQDKIENTEAVDACVALNIIGGYEDGSYHPERNIKRSEITKMICVALNGGKEPNVGTNVTPTFSDVRGTSAAWAEGYIESCVAQGIVSGVGGGRFSPAGNVTASQLAKMPWDTQDSMYFSAQAAVVPRTSEKVGVPGVARFGSLPPFRATQIILVISDRLMLRSG